MTKEKVPFLALLWLYVKTQFRLMCRDNLTFKESMIETLKASFATLIFMIAGLILTIIIAAMIGFVRTILN